MNLQAQIASKAQGFQQASKDAQASKEARLQQAVEQLTPMFHQLQEGLAGTHLTVLLHTDPSHLPCPAIHIRGMHPFTPPYDRLSEIFLLTKDPETRWMSGSCNRHTYAHKDDAALLDFVATWVGYDLAKYRQK